MGEGAGGLPARATRGLEGLDRRAHVESWQATPPLRGWEEKEQSARLPGAVGDPISP
jgi:hypothetical protein